MVAEVGQFARLVEVKHTVQRFIAHIRVFVGGKCGLLLGVVLDVFVVHQEVDEFARFLLMLGVCSHGENHVIACGELLFAGIVGCRHLRETQVGIAVDESDLRNRVGAEWQNRGFACGQILRGLLVSDGRILLRVVLVDLDQLIADSAPQVGEFLRSVFEGKIFGFRHQRGVE